MGIENKCLFYRKTDNPGMGLGIGYCDLGVVWAICDGYIKFCEEPDALIRNIYIEWEKNRAREMRENAQSDRTL
jgi:hypothetical protein